MKKIILILMLLLIPQFYAESISIYKNKVKEKIEIIEAETKTYSGEHISLEERVENAEIYVFGKAKTGDLSERVEDIAGALGVSLEKEKILEKDNKEETFLDKESSHTIKENSQISNQNDDYVYYSPKTAIKEFEYLEKKLLGKNFNKDDISNRLSRVETKIFSRTFENEDNDTRLERLKSVQQAVKSNKEYKINKFAKFAATGVQIGGLVLLILAVIL